MNPFVDVWNSFKNNPDGLSGRKMSAFWSITIVATALSFKFGSLDNVIQLVLIWLGFGAVCLTLVSITELIKIITIIKNGRANETTTEPEQENKADL